MSFKMATEGRSPGSRWHFNPKENDGMSLSAEQLAAIDAELANGNRITAIREYRTFTGSDVSIAKRFIDARFTELRGASPTTYPRPIRTVQPDPSVMATITPVTDRDLRSLRRVLRTIEKLLFGFNYQVTLSASAASVPSGSLPVIETMASLYPDSKPGSAETTITSLADFKSDVTECLTYEGDLSSGPRFNDRARLKLNERLIPDLWREIDQFAPLEASVILSFSSDAGLPGYHVFWFFAYLIHCPSKQRCLVLSGMSSD